MRALNRDGDWLLRIEDIDPPREVPGASDAIVESLHRHGFRWTGDVLYQSTRQAAYDAVLAQLLASGQAYHCVCSRREIRMEAVDGVAGPVYPGTCRHLPPPADLTDSAIRIKTRPCQLVLRDVIQQRRVIDLATDVGDFVIRRRDGLTAYALAVVVDDEFQRITEVVRGTDLLSVTPTQLWLQRLLGYRQPDYLHVPVAVNSSGQKLSKQTGAAALDDNTATGNLLDALRFLGLSPPRSLRGATPDSIWQWARGGWQPEALYGVMQRTWPAS